MKKVIIIVFVSLFVLLKGYSQTIEIYEDSRGNKYAAIHSKGLPENKVENRNENVEFYTNIQLYEYTSNGQNTNPILDENGNSIFVNRIARHTNNRNVSRIDWKVSLRFIISPDVVYSDGNDSEGNNQGTTVQMNWATANGYLATANSNTQSTASYAVPKGCTMYRGKDGKDEPGTWRTPTLREGSMIMVYYKELEATADKGTNFKPFANSTVSTTSTTYWLATEYNNTEAWKITFYPDETKVKYTSGRNSKSANCYLRCIRDIPL